MLTADEVRAIRRDEVGTHKDQARRHGVSYNTIRDLKQRRTYREIPDLFETSTGEVIRGVGVFGSP